MRYLGTALLLLLLAACGRGAQVSVVGERVEVLATWSGAEQDRFELVLGEFERRTGAVVAYASAQHRLPDELAARLATGDPPDVRARGRAAVLLAVPVVALARMYVGAHLPLDVLGGAALGLAVDAAVAQAASAREDAG